MESQISRSDHHEWPQRISPEMRKMTTVLEENPPSGITPETLLRKLGVASEVGANLEKLRDSRNGQDPTGGLTV